uniref:Uncharacterized protein n=1 Tax=Rhizophora mucronata TaxID=61149 RepID=A0A2P2P4X2_RHIMU
MIPGSSIICNLSDFEHNVCDCTSHHMIFPLLLLFSLVYCFFLP